MGARWSRWLSPGLLVGYMSILILWKNCGGFKISDPAILKTPLGWHEMTGRAAGAVKQTYRGEKLVVQTSTLDQAPWKTSVMLELPAQSIAIWPKPGQLLAADGFLRPPQKAESPGVFNEKNYLEDQGIFWVFSAESVVINSTSVSWAERPFYWAQSVRYFLQEKFLENLSSQTAALMDGVVFGFKGPIPSALNQEIQDAGVMHLLVPSGAKMALILFGLLWLCGLAHLGPGQRWIICAIFGGFYLLMVGKEPPYARAYAMGLAILAGLATGREGDAWQALILSAWVILILRPLALFSLGFQMSYAATASLILIMPRLHRLLSPIRPPFLRPLIETAVVTLIVQTVLWPFFTRTFGRAAFLGALANIPLIPLAAALMALGWLLGFGALISQKWIVPPIAFLIEKLVSLFCRICAFFSHVPLAAFSPKPLTGFRLLAYYLLFGFGIIFFSRD